MSTASRGAQREHAVKRLLEAEGWAVTRGAGSHGCADLWAARREAFIPVFHGVVADGPEERVGLWLVQVKGNVGSPWKTFGPKEREALIALADQTGGTPWLVHWPPHGERKWIAEDEGPRAKVAA